MPGTPDPVLGSTLLTVVASLLASLVVVAFAYRARDATDPRTLALAGGGSYAVAAVTLWAAVRVATGTFALVSGSWQSLAGLALVTALVVLVHTSLALYLRARWNYLTPLAVLAATTYLLSWLFLHVRGETDPIGLYWILAGPSVLVGIVALAAVEYAVRAAVGRVVG